MTFDLADFQDTANLTKCQHPQDDITLADGSTILPDGIGTVSLTFRVNGHSEKIFLSGVRYCPKLDTKLISLGMLDRKGLAYSSQHGIISVRDDSSTIMIGHLTPHNLYKVDLLEAIEEVTIPTDIEFSRAMTAGTSKSAADLATWHRRLAHLNEASVKRLSTMVTGMDILQSQDKTPSLCTVCVEAKMTRQPHRDARPHSSQPGFRLHANVGGGGKTYTTFRGFRYFILFVCEATGHVWVRFLKKKSDALPAFQNLVTLIYRQHGIRVCILHTDFGEFNSDLAAKYFEETGIIWESSAPNAQQQNGLVERLMRTIVEGARAMMLDSHLPLILWAEALTTMTYIRNRSPTPFTVQQSTVTPFQAWNHGAQPTIDHLRIFGSTTYVFNESQPLPKLAAKSWTGYLVGYEGRHQYRIYDPDRHAVFVRRDVIFNEALIGPKIDTPIADSGTALESEVALGFPTLCFPYIPWVDEFGTSSASPALEPASPLDIQRLRADGLASSLAEHATIPTPTAPLPSSSSMPQFNPNTHEDNPTLSSDSEDELTPPPPSPKESPVPQSQRRSARLETKPTPDYYGISRGKISTVKTNSSVPLNSPHSKASQALYDYALSHIDKQEPGGFVRIARKAKTSKPDFPTLKQAMNGGEVEEWKKAMQVEYDALISNGTWKLVDRPSDQHVLTAKWAFRRKRDIEGNIKRYKARWVARGFEQREGVDYFETFAAVVKASTNKALFAISAKRKLHSHQVDMITAFLNSRLTERVYIEQPQYFHNGNKNQVLLLLQGLYGLKQAARLWFDTFKEEMQKLGFVQSHYDSALYLNNNGTYVAVYVDDLHIVGPDLPLIITLKRELAAKFKTTDLGPTSHYLGMEVVRKKNTIIVTQTVYIDQLLAGHQMSNCNPAHTPMVEGLSLVPAPEEYSPNPKDVSAYKRFTGSIQWLACQTRPDILQTVAKLSQHNVKPTEQCWAAVTRLLRYLKGTRTRGICYGDGDLIPYGYSDSSWADDLYNRRSTAGYVFILNGGPVSWSSRRQATVSTSTCEAEYIAQAETACEAVWLRGLLGELGILDIVLEDGYPKTISPPTTIFADNQGAIKLTENPEYHRKTKHIPIKYHKTRELVEAGVVRFEWIPTEQMVADGLTKPLGTVKFREFVAMLGLVDL